MTNLGDDADSSQIQINARADDEARQYIAGRDQVVFAGSTLPLAATMRTLPRDVTAFTGRDAELQQLIAAASGAAGAVAVHTVDGMPGVGKTALVTRAAHQLVGNFPDGQLFVGLHAHTPGMQPADPVEVLAGLLTCTGMTPGEIPEGLEARAERWRGRVAGKRVLLVLDDAAGHAQVEPLLPGTAGCLVLITSRRRLIALDNAQPLPLGTLPPFKAIDLLIRMARLPQDNFGAVAELARLCGHLPLAITLLAGRLAHHPSWNITQYAANFAAAQDRLTELAAGDRPGDPAVAAAFEMSYQHLPQDRQRLFRFLGLHPGTDIDVYAAAALVGVPLTKARHDLDALYTDHLIDEPTVGRYRLHDLIREYARTLTIRHDPAASRDQAAGDLLNYYQHTAQAAGRHLTRYTSPGPTVFTTTPAAAPDLPGRPAAVTWMRTERANLLACIDSATTQVQPERIIALTSAIAAFLYQEGPWQQAALLHHAAATAACLIDDFLGEANALHDLGRVRYMTDDYRIATGQQERALTIYKQLGDRLGEANAIHDLGRIRLMTGDYPPATGLLQRALAIYQHLGDRLGEANALHELGRIHYTTGDYPPATGLLQRALAIYQHLGRHHGEANALHELGRVRYATGDYPAATALQKRALVICQDLGHRHGEASALWDLGRVRLMTTDYASAKGLLEQALVLYRHLGSRLGEANALQDLGRVHYATGDYAASSGPLQRALELYREVGDLQGEAEALISTGALIAESVGPQEAVTLYGNALRLARRVHSPMDEAQALEGTARCAADMGDQAVAIDSLSKAVVIYQRIGAAQAVTAMAYLDTISVKHGAILFSNRPTARSTW